MDNLELVRAFESLAVHSSAPVVSARLADMLKQEVAKLADAHDPADMFRAQGRYQVLSEISKWLDLDYLKDLKLFLQEQKR